MNTENILINVIRNDGYCGGYNSIFYNTDQRVCKTCIMEQNCNYITNTTFGEFPSFLGTFNTPTHKKRRYVAALNMYKRMFGEDKLFEELL